MSVTSDIALAQGGNYYRAITRKGKVFIAKTGISLASVGFSSVALGDRQSATAFADKGPGTQYGMLHLIRRLQTDAVNVYWDEPQKGKKAGGAMKTSQHGTSGVDVYVGGQKK